MFAYFYILPAGLLTKKHLKPCCRFEKQWQYNFYVKTCETTSHSKSNFQ